jgi:hypothetical protein
MKKTTLDAKVKLAARDDAYALHAKIHKTAAEAHKAWAAMTKTGYGSYNVFGEVATLLGDAADKLYDEFNLGGEK